jgi:hypothetical protein
VASSPSKPDDRVLRYLKLCAERTHGIPEDQIAHDLDFGSPAALYRQLSQDGFPVCPVCGDTPVKPNHCRENQGRRRRRARRGTGQAIELPSAKRAEDLFRKAIRNAETDLLHLNLRREFYSDERFDAISDYPETSTTFARENLPPGEEGDEIWRKLCTRLGRDPSVGSFVLTPVPTITYLGATQSPPEPLTQLIAIYVIAGEPLDALLDALHPDPSGVDKERLHQAVDELWRKAGQLATLVRGGVIRRGPSTGEVSPYERSTAHYISHQLSKGIAKAQIREALRRLGYSQQEITRLMNLKIGPPQ